LREKERVYWESKEGRWSWMRMGMGTGVNGSHLHREKRIDPFGKGLILFFSDRPNSIRPVLPSTKRRRNKQKRKFEGEADTQKGTRKEATPRSTQEEKRRRGKAREREQRGFATDPLHGMMRVE